MRQLGCSALLTLPESFAFAHGIGGKDASFVAATKGTDILPFMYLGAKHMVTGYDHLLFILGVIFFLYRMRDVVIYVTLFSIGHSVTLLAGVLLKLEVSAYLIDAVIGLGRLQGVRQSRRFKSVAGFQPNNRIAVAIRPDPWLRARHQAAGIPAQPQRPPPEHDRASISGARWANDCVAISSFMLQWRRTAAERSAVPPIR